MTISAHVFRAVDVDSDASEASRTASSCGRAQGLRLHARGVRHDLACKLHAEGGGEELPGLVPIAVRHIFDHIQHPDAIVVRL